KPKSTFGCFGFGCVMETSFRTCAYSAKPAPFWISLGRRTGSCPKAIATKPVGWSRSMGASSSKPVLVSRSFKVFLETVKVFLDRSLQPRCSPAKKTVFQRETGRFLRIADSFPQETNRFLRIADRLPQEANRFLKIADRLPQEANRFLKIADR